MRLIDLSFFFFFQADVGIRDGTMTGVQTCALPICGLAEAVGIVRPQLDDAQSSMRTDERQVDAPHRRELRRPRPGRLPHLEGPLRHLAVRSVDVRYRASLSDRREA